MGNGPQITIAILGADGIPVPVGPDNPIPTQAGN